MCAISSNLNIENTRLKKLLAERDLEVEVMKKVSRENGSRARASADGGIWHNARRVTTTGLRAVQLGALGIPFMNPGWPSRTRRYFASCIVWHINTCALVLGELRFCLAEKAFR